MYGQMIISAAEAAPTFTEALLHHLMEHHESSSSISPMAKHTATLMSTLNLAASRSRLTSPDNPARGGHQGFEGVLIRKLL